MGPQAVNVLEGQGCKGDHNGQEPKDGDVASNVNGLVGCQMSSSDIFVGQKHNPVLSDKMSRYIKNVIVFIINSFSVIVDIVVVLQPCIIQNPWQCGCIELLD